MIQFYKPNPKVSGTACSFWVTQNGDAMASMIKQASWNDAKKTGSFSANKGNSQNYADFLIKIPTTFLYLSQIF